MDRDIYNVLLGKLKELEAVITSIPTIDSDVSTLKTDVSDLKIDVAALKPDVSELKLDVSALETATEYSSATLEPASADVSFSSLNYIIRIGKLLVYHIAVKLDGSGTAIPANTWKNLMTIPEGFRMKTADEVAATNLETYAVDASVFYDNTTHVLQIYPYTQVTALVGFSCLLVGEAEADA